MVHRPKSFKAKAAPTPRQIDRQRGSARERGYSAAWDRAAKVHLAASPLCRYCHLAGHDEPATLVDHLYPHRQYPGAFWLTDLWVSSCAPCHSGFKQALETSGRAAIDGLARRLGLPTLAQALGG